MRYPTRFFCIAASICPLVALATTKPVAPKPMPTDIPQPVDQLPVGMRPATDQETREAVQAVEDARLGAATPAPDGQAPAAARDLTRNPRLSIEQRLVRIERLSSQLQREAMALREDLHPRLPQTQPGPLPEDERVPDVHFR